MADPKETAPEADVDGPASEDLREEPIDGDGLLQLVLEEHEARIAEARPAKIEGVVVGELVGVEGTVARVTYPGGPEDGAVARVMTAIDARDIGGSVALLFEGGDPDRPVIMGKMHVPAGQTRPHASVDAERLELSAEKEIVLRCGEASITLTRAGKILIRGAYVLSRSSGVHRIQGGSVQIN